jgi:hypothetical protein
MSSVNSGDMTSAQTSAATIQNDQSQIDSLISTSSSTSQASGFRATMKADLSNLLSAVQSGDQSKASAALDQLKTDRASRPGRAGNDGDGDDNKTAAASSAPKTLATDLKGMLTALISGDASGAASFATALQTDVGNMLGTKASTTTTDTSSSVQTTYSAGSFLADLKALVGAVSSGDTSTTQADAGTLAGNLTSATGAVHHGGHHHHGNGGAPPPDATANNPVQSILSLLQSVAKLSTPSSAATQASAVAA